MKILITGSTGFVGSHLLEKISKNKNFQLILPVRSKNKLKNFYDNPSVKIIPFNEDLEKIVVQSNPDVVINLLGILTEIPERNATFEKLHFEFTKRLVDGSKKSNVSLFIQMSALGVDLNSKSRYKKTKALAEKYIIESGLTYFIFRPSMILGKGQKLFEDLKFLSRIFPVFIAPRGKVQPVHINDVVESFIQVLSFDERNQIFELSGKRIVSYKDLFEFALKLLNIKRPVFEVNRNFLFPISLIGSIFGKPITLDQWYMLEKDNICLGDYKGVYDILGSVRDAFDIKI